MSELSELAAQGAAIVEKQERTMLEMAEHYASSKNAMQHLIWLSNSVAMLESPSDICKFNQINMQLIHFAATLTLTRMLQESVVIAADKERNNDDN